jgi:DNA-binding NtrC family response regulator
MVAMNVPRIVGNPNLAFVIDDEAKIREFMASTLADLGMKVETFVMAREAMASLELGHPVVIFLDVALLRSDAIDVIRGLSERQYGGLVQLMSGGRPSLLEAIQRIGMRHGMKLAPPLNKPITREAIAHVVENMRAVATVVEPDRHEAALAQSATRH